MGVVAPGDEFGQEKLRAGSGEITEVGGELCEFYFRQPRLREIIYLGMGERDRAETHVALGRAMFERGADVSAVVIQINRGRSELEGPAERAKLARLNFEAARKARASCAHEIAREYLEIACELLPSDAWQQDFDTAYEFYRMRMESAYTCGLVEEGDELAGLLTERLPSAEDVAQVLRVQQVQYTALGRYGQAMHFGLKALECLGVSLSLDPGWTRISLAMRRAKRALQSRALADIASARAPHSVRLQLLFRILDEFKLAAFVGGHDRAFALASLEQLDLSLREGNGTYSSTAYICYGYLLGWGHGQWERGFEMGRLGLRVNELVGNAASESGAKLFYALMIHSWNHPWQSMRPLLERVVESGRKSGYSAYVSHAAANLFMWDPQMDLESRIEAGERSILTISEYGERSNAWDLAQIVHHRHLALSRQTEDPCSLSSRGFKEEDAVARMRTSDFLYGVAAYWTVKLELALLAGDHDACAESVNKLEPLEARLAGLPWAAYACQMLFLGWSELVREARGLEAWALRRKMQAARKRMALWTENCRENFLHRRLMMDAELARWRGRTHVAMALYEEAIRAARSAGFLFDEAMISELAARYYADHGHLQIAGQYYRDAEDCYAHWGAVTKAREMHAAMELNIELTSTFVNANGSRSGNTQLTTSNVWGRRALAPGSGSGAGNEGLDISTVIKASHALSGEVRLADLLQELMRVVRENAGAERAVLLLKSDSNRDYEVQAELSPRWGCRVLQDVALADYPEIPQAIVRYAIRCHEPVILGDAAREGAFVRDPDVSARSVSSVLCFPIIHHGALAGVLYLENNLTTHAFSPERLQLLEVIAAQAAISIENARLYTTLEMRVAERTRQLEEAQRELVDAAHTAGMAEIASSVLHNVGNLLNSVNTSTELLRSLTEHSAFENLQRANCLLSEHMESLVEFISHDPKGMQLMRFYLQLGDALGQVQHSAQNEARVLVERVEAIKHVVAVQQRYAAGVSMFDALDPVRVVEDAINIALGGRGQKHFELVRNFAQVPQVRAERSKLVHVLVNLLKNADEAMRGIQREKHELRVRIERNDEIVHIEVEDTGCGVREDDRSHIFTHGFTTKHNGHGFGLHSCAIYMLEMEGKIELADPGPEGGAVFRLALPVAVANTGQPEFATTASGAVLEAPLVGQDADVSRNAS